MTTIAILLIALLCIAWLIVIAASQLTEAASMIDNENNNQENE